MSRLFFALWPDPETRNKIAEVSGKTGLTTGSIIPQTNLHMTIAFLGMVDSNLIGQLSIAAASISSRGFSLVIDQFGWWKPSRILWLSPGQVPPALLELHDSITSRVSHCGISVESRGYLPHITLARNVNCGVSVQYEPIHWNVTEFCLVESIPRLGYTEYKIIQRWPLS